MRPGTGSGSSRCRLRASTSRPTSTSRRHSRRWRHSYRAWRRTWNPTTPACTRPTPIDFEVVLSGEVICELDDGAEVTLKQGDTFVQNGTRHRWRNPGPSRRCCSSPSRRGAPPVTSPAVLDNRCRGRRRWPRGRRGRDHARPCRARRRRHRQGSVPPRQVLRRRLDRGSAPPARGARPRPGPRSPSWQPVDDVVVRSPSGRVSTFPLPRGQGLFAAVARRADLDAALLDVARARWREGARRSRAAPTCAARTTIGSSSTWTGSARCTRTTPSARTACGRPLRKAVGATTPGYLGEWHAFRQYFTDVAPEARQLWVWFEPDLLPGYAWSFPLAGRAGERRLRHPANRACIDRGASTTCTGR